MNGKKNVIVALAMISAASLVAMQGQADLKVLYNQLLVQQGTVAPALARVSATIEAEHKLESIFDAAKTTGLIAQYKQLLTSLSRNQFINDLTRPSVVAMIAFMQNLFGGGQPFAYKNNDAFKKDADRQGMFIDPVLGSYMSPKGEITITWYSFFNGLLDTLIELSKDPARRADSYFKSVCERFVQGIVSAMCSTVCARKDLGY